MSSSSHYPIPESFKDAWMTEQKYQQLYRHSLENPEAFWANKAERYLDWFGHWDTVFEGDFSKGDVHWFKGGQLNASYNCLDRHLPDKADKVAIYWEGDSPEQQRVITYRQLYQQVCQLANGLKTQGVNKGDRVCIYMPMIPEATVAMLACARIGAVHSVVFGGFAPHSLRDRILDCDCRTLITADEGARGGKIIPLKQNADEALKECSGVDTVIVVEHTGRAVDWQEGRDISYRELTENQSAECEPEIMDAEDPLFILYTSGSTGKPKGVLHTTAGYLLYTTVTFHYVFDYREADIYWCAADIGWITGHSYIVYGPLSNGATQLMYEGLPYWPDASRIWQMVDRYKVNILYTAPTAIRALMAKGKKFVESTSRKSLRILGTVGEPINPEAWQWYHQTVGKGNCPVVDTWWQTETGGMMITACPGATELYPGSATKPFLGIRPALLDNEGNEIIGAGSGSLVLTKSWPSQIRTVYGDHQRMLDTYFTQFPGYYCTGDGARRDEHGNYWITGRIDDVLSVSGHRLGTAEIESALVLHKAIAEAAVVGVPHSVKGESIHAFVILMDGVEVTEVLQAELADFVASEIGPIARPETIHFSPALPKTRSGKIMRRILRKLAQGETEDLGDITTLSNPSVISRLLASQAGS